MNDTKQSPLLLEFAVLVGPCLFMTMLEVFSSRVVSSCGLESFTPRDVEFSTSTDVSIVRSTSSSVASGSGEFLLLSSWFVSVVISVSPLLGSTPVLLELVALMNEGTFLPPCRQSHNHYILSNRTCISATWNQVCKLPYWEQEHALGLWKKSIAAVEASGVV